MSYEESARWDYPDINRVRRRPSAVLPPVKPPSVDKNMRTLANGVRLTMSDGSVLALQGWCPAPFVKTYWCVAHEGAAFPGEMRLVWCDGTSVSLADGYRYRASGRRAHADGSVCLHSYACRIGHEVTEESLP